MHTTERAAGLTSSLRRAVAILRSLCFTANSCWTQLINDWLSARDKLTVARGRAVGAVKPHQLGAFDRDGIAIIEFENDRASHVDSPLTPRA